MKKIEWRIKFLQGLKLLFSIILAMLLYKSDASLPVWVIYISIFLLEFFSFLWISRPIIKTEHILTRLGEGVDQIHNSEDLELDKKVEKVFQWLQETSSREYKMQVLRKEAELNELQSQINPHFLYNTLESIRGEALMEDMDEIADMTEALGYFFRYSISRKKTIVTLEEELKNIQYYFFIQKFRFGEHIDMSVEIEDETLKQLLMPKLTIQPIVENAIFHGLETQMEKGHVSISAGKTDQRLVLVISDDGKGISERELEQLNERLGNGIDLSEAKEEGGKNGIALDNVNQRIKIRFGNEYGLHVYSTLGIGTDVVVNLPVTECDGKTDYEDGMGV